MAARRKQRRKCQNHPIDENLEQYRKLVSEAKYVLKKSKKESLNNFISSLTHDTPQSKIWSKLRAFKSTYIPPTFPLEEEGQKILDPVNKANLFASHFKINPVQQNPNETEYKQYIEEAVEQEGAANNRDITETELKNSLKSLKNKSPGPDMLPNVLLQNLHPSYTEELLNIYNQSLTTGIVPKQWKYRHIIPIPKPQKPKIECASYRPITLLSCLGKLIDRILQKRLEYYMETRHTLQEVKVASAQEGQLLISSRDYAHRYNTVW